jgi:hypothetical protein
MPLEQHLIDNYFNDIEHGFFHGLCSCIVAYIINSTIDPHTWSSIILHDFLKCSGCTQEIHDIQLKLFFDKLHPVTYRHSKIAEHNAKWILVKADRIELRRYHDLVDWADDRYQAIIANLDQARITQIDYFYSSIRPALLYFYTNRNKTFIRHGYESYKKPYDDFGSYPPKSSYWKVLTQSYPIEIDTIPFSNPNCSNHGGTKLWNKIKGYITLEDFKCLGGTTHAQSYRDHIMAKSDINIKNWRFIINNASENNHLKMIEYLKNAGVNIIDQDMLSDFFAVFKLLHNRINALNPHQSTVYN